jgi:hypothetical protein
MGCHRISVRIITSDVDFLWGGARISDGNTLVDAWAAGLAARTRTLRARTSAEVTRRDGSEAVLSIRAAVGAKVLAGGDAGRA